MRQQTKIHQLSIASLNLVIALGFGLLIGLSGCSDSPTQSETLTPLPSFDNSTDDSFDFDPPAPAAPLDLAPLEEPAEGETADAVEPTATQPTAGTTETLVGDPSEREGVDWTFWRGPAYNGTSPETGLIDDWDPAGGAGSNVSWKRTDIGGRSTPVVMNGRLYLLTRAERETSKEGEKIVCLNALTGETIWENRFNVWLSDVPDTRVGWSNVTADPATGNIYALGVCGYFQCVNGETGKTIWSVSMHERFGLLSTYGGRTNTPVIVDDIVIISSIVIGYGNMAKPAHRLIGFDKNTGTVVWFNGTRPLPYDTNYSSPTVTALAGQKALVFGSGDGAVWAFQPRTGQPIWQYKLSRRGLNVSPLVIGDQVFSGHSEENIMGTTMGAVVLIDASGKGDVTSSGEVWKHDEVMMGKSSPISIGDRIYCFDDRAKIYVYDKNSGEQIGNRIALGRVMRGSPLVADGKIYAIGNSGNWAIMQTDEDAGLIKIANGRLSAGESMDASPIVSHGRLYLQTSGGLYCLEDSSKTSAVGAGNPQGVEAALEDKTVAHLQVIPADALVKPGEQIQYTVRTYNAVGQLLGETDAVTFTAAQHGEFSGSVFTAAADVAHVATDITVTAGDVKGTARVRIVPGLPWKFDFEELSAPPVSWVGARYRHIVREVDGSNVMVKITTIPKGTRSRSWMGYPDLSNYTITADVQGARTNDKMPDIGLLAQGYALDLQGENQKLQIRSWVPQQRMAKSIDFTWKENTWYTVKFKAAVEDGVAVLRAKVWVRGEEEPQAWLLEATDDVPNTQGSPGLYGNAKDAELFVDNISVTANSTDE
jgi:outer membrane protein assembly factor BamB